MTNERAYTPSLVLHVLRNPHGWSAEAITAARLQAADEIERLRDALKRVRRVAAEGTTHTGMIAALGILVDRALNPGNGPLPPDYTYHSHEPSEQRLRTPLGEPALTHVDGLPGTRESVVIEPQGNADESPALFPQQMEPDTSPLTHQEMFSAIHSLAADIVRLTAAVPAQCTQGASRDASSEFVCPNHGPVQQLTDSGDCPMCYQDRHAQRTGE